MKRVRTDRGVVYQCIDGERDYQSKWDDVESEGDHTETEFVLFMEDYLSEAKHLLSRNAAEDVREDVLGIIRKVTAMGVACMEQNGCVFR